MSNNSRTVQARTDFYTVIHKSLRKRLFEAVVLAGSSDLDDEDDRAKLSRTLADVVKMMREHAEHEEQFLHPIIAEVMPDLAQVLHAEHEEHNRGLEEVGRAFEVAFSERTAGAGHCAYRALARFAGRFLAHAEEEEANQPVLWEKAGEARFAAGMAAFKGSRTLEQTLAGFAHLLPAMNASERFALFEALRAGAPEAVATGATQVARQVLGAREWQVLEESLP